MAKITKDYTSMLKPTLQKELKKRGIAFKKSDKRDDLIAMLVATERPQVDTGDISNVVITIWAFVAILGMIALLIKVL